MRAQWASGEWHTLANLREDEITQRPERAKLAIFAACAQYQVGDHINARHLTDLALEWGCNQQAAEHILLVGAQNSLDRAIALLAEQKNKNY